MIRTPASWIGLPVLIAMACSAGTQSGGGGQGGDNGPGGSNGEGGSQGAEGGSSEAGSSGDAGSPSGDAGTPGQGGAAGALGTGATGGGPAKGGSGGTATGGAGSGGRGGSDGSAQGGIGGRGGSGSPIFYVRQGATGNGSDWSNAFGALPATLQRGATYYIADGSYGAYTFDDTVSGAQLIVIRKATGSDHGTNAGWVSTHGDGQAVFNSTLVFKRGHYVFDGQTRNESDWFDGTTYGFRVAHNNQNQNIIISDYGVSIANVTIKHVFVDAIYGNLPSTTVRRYAVDTDGFDGGTTATNLLFTKMYVRGSNNVWFLRTTSGAIVEYSASDGVDGNSANHGEIVNLYYSGNNATIRHNKFRNAYQNGGGTALVAITYANGLKFYGNVAWDFATGDGAVGFLGGDASNCLIYNNTFVNGTGANIFSSSGTNNLVYNNFWIGGSFAGVEGTHNYNAFSGGNARGEANAQINVPTSIFVNYAGNDFRLAAPTSAGMTLAAPYSIALDGVTRGADGTWDRGAYEYTVSSDKIPPTTPTNLSGTPTSSSTVDLSWTASTL